MAGTTIRPENEGGGRKLSDETRAKLSAAQKAHFAALPPEEQAARRARLDAGRRKPANPTPPAPPPASGGRPNPLDDAPGATAGGGPTLQGRQASRVAPPLFHVPDLPPLEVGGGEPLDGQAPEIDPGVLGQAFGVSEDEIGDLLDLGFDWAAIRRGKHWKLHPDERELLSGALSRSVNKNALVARALGSMIDPLVIVFGFGLVIWVRIDEDRKHARPIDHDPAPARARGGDPAPADGHRNGAPGRGPGQSGGGSLNGFASLAQRAARDPGDEEVPADDQGHVLSQAL